MLLRVACGVSLSFALILAALLNSFWNYRRVRFANAERDRLIPLDFGARARARYQFIACSLNFTTFKVS